MAKSGDWWRDFTCQWCFLEAQRMKYEILNPDTLPDYLRGIAANLPSWFEVNTNLEITELSDGNLNAVYRVKTSHSSLLVKQGLPYLRVAGEAWQLSSHRAAFEAKALEWQQRLAPGFVPEPYFFDAIMCVNIMEDLRGYRVIRHPMITRLEIADLGATIGTFLSKTLFGTSDFALTSQAKKSLQAQFNNWELCEITEDLIFTEPFEANLLNHKINRNQFEADLKPSLEQLQNNTALRLEVAHLKHKFMTSGQALLHGDLHTGSIMADSSNIRVIDPEFAFFGPMGFDLGLFLANLYLNALAQIGHAPDQASARVYQTYLLLQAQNCWESFSNGFTAQLKESNSVSWRNPDFARTFLLGVLQDACGFAGCEIIRRSVGFAHVLDVDSIADQPTRVAVLEQNLRLGSSLILNRGAITEYTDLQTFVQEFL
jgi:5-methylthioribose kinase